MSNRAVAAAVFFALCVFGLSAFTIGAATQPARVRWDSLGPIGSVAVRDKDFSGTFIASISPGGSAPYGQALFRMGGIACRSSAAGTTDGGTNDLWMKVVHEDGGIDCECDMGASSCTANTTTDVVCDCSGGMTQLSGAQWTVRPSTNTTCATFPASMHCYVDLFR